MKQFRSQFLKAVAVFLLLFPIHYIFLVAIFFDVPFEDCFSILFSPLFFMTVMGVAASGYGFWEMKRWSWYVFLASQILLFYENTVIVRYYSQSYHEFFAFAFLSAIQLLLIYRVGREIMVPHYYPKIRWWESNPRFRLEAPVKISYQRDFDDPKKVYEAKILDCSSSGCFVKTRDPFSYGETIYLSFEILHREFVCEGKVVWKAQSAVTHPAGIGVKFRSLTARQKKSLKRVSARLQRVALFYRRYRYWLSQEEFERRLVQVETGTLIPKGRVRTLVDLVRKSVRK